MRKVLPVVLILALLVALIGGVLVMKNGLTTTPVLLLVIGLAGAAGLGFRIGGLGGMDPREVSAKIHERAQKNLESETGKGRNAR